MNADVTKLSATIAALSPTKGARRPKGKVFTLTLQVDVSILQGPRGNIVKNFWGTHAEMRAAAEAHIARIPGATLNVY